MRKRYCLLTLLLCTISLGFTINSSAQSTVCTGKWGSPIVDENFGQGTASTGMYGPLSTYAPGVTTSTIFVTNPPLPDGESCLTPNCDDVGQGWLNIGDHTGNTNGLMMLINAPSTAATVFFEYTMNNLCPNTVLQLSVWIINVNPIGLDISNPGNYQYPNMAINLIDVATNAVIATTSTGDIADDGMWHNFTLNFNNVNSSNVKMQLVNNSVGSGFGNDLAIDDITVTPCVPLSHVAPSFDTVICETGLTIPFTGQVTGNIYNPPNYIWQYSSDSGANWINGTTVSTNPGYTFTANTAGVYWVRFLVGPTGFNGGGNCSGISDTSIVRLITTVPSYTPLDTAICTDGLFYFTAHIDSDTTRVYEWESSTDMGATWSMLNPTKDSNYTQIIFAPGTYLIRFISYPEGLENEGGCAKPSAISTIRRNADIHVRDVVTDAECFGSKDGILNITTLSGQLPLTFSLEPGGMSNQTGNFTGLDTGTYIVQITDADNKCQDSIEDIVVQQPTPLTIRDTIIKVEPTCLKDANGSISVLALGGTIPYIYELDSVNQYTIDGNFTGLLAGNYILNVKDNHNCTVSEPIELTAQACCKVFLPSAFTPNNDGKNDRYKASSNSAIHSLDLHVFNRYGQEVYHSISTEDRGWDGTYNNQPADIGTYFYVASYFCEDVNREIVQKGDVTLIR